MKALEKILNLDYIIAGTALSILIIVTFGGVIMRYFVGNPIIWGEEVQLFCFVWTVFFGAGAAFRTGSHVAIDVIVDMFPEKLRKVVEIAGYFVVLGVLIFLLSHSLPLIKQLAATGRTTNILKVPYSFIYSSLPIGCVLMIINYTLFMYKMLKGGDK